MSFQMSIINENVTIRALVIHTGDTHWYSSNNLYQRVTARIRIAQSTYPASTIEKVHHNRVHRVLWTRILKHQVCAMMQDIRFPWNWHSSCDQWKCYDWVQIVCSLQPWRPHKLQIVSQLIMHPDSLLTVTSFRLRPSNEMRLLV